MKILIATPLSGKDVGGPSAYGSHLKEEFIKRGEDVKMAIYGNVEKRLPTGARHLYFFFKSLPAVWWADRVIALDTFSVGIPVYFASKLLHRKLLLRIGGDFLWESYANRTGEKVTLSEFCARLPQLSSKEKIVFHLTKKLLQGADAIAFNTEWQKDIWAKCYEFSLEKASVIRNLVPGKKPAIQPIGKCFIAAGRENKIKNLEALKDAASKISDPSFKLEIIKNMPHSELMDKIRESYAVIQPSFSDVCPNFILEAASFCKPFIMTKETGLREIYDKGGIFVDPMNKAELISAIETMLNKEEYNRLTGELKSINVVRNWDQVADEYLKLCH